jgi:hypothetical protein
MPVQRVLEIQRFANSQLYPSRCLLPHCHPSPPCFSVDRFLAVPLLSSSILFSLAFPSCLFWAGLVAPVSFCVGKKRDSWRHVCGKSPDIKAHIAYPGLSLPFFAGGLVMFVWSWARLKKPVNKPDWEKKSRLAADGNGTYRFLDWRNEDYALQRKSDLWRIAFSARWWLDSPQI